MISFSDFLVCFNEYYDHMALFRKCDGVTGNKLITKKSALLIFFHDAIGFWDKIHSIRHKSSFPEALKY